MDVGTMLNYLAIALQLFAAGALMIWPEQKWIGFTLMAIGAAVALIGGGLFLSRKEVFASLKRFWFLLPIGMAIGILFVWFFSLIPAFQSSNISFTSSWQRWESMAKDLKRVEGKTFINEEVPLDGHAYINCDFKNVRFVFEGKAPFSLVRNKWSSPYIDPKSPALNALVLILRELDLLDKTRRFYILPAPKE
jgi:hypothetical protein